MVATATALLAHRCVRNAVGHVLAFAVGLILVVVGYFVRIAAGNTRVDVGNAEANVGYALVAVGIVGFVVGYDLLDDGCIHLAVEHSLVAVG